MSGVGMSEGMNRRLFVNVTFFHGCAKSALDAALVHGLTDPFWFLPIVTHSRKQPNRVAMGSPVSSQHLQAGRGERDVTIFSTFSLAQVNHFAFTIDIFDLQTHAFQQAQPAGINEGQADSIALTMHAVQNTPYFFYTQHDWQLVLFGRAQEVKGLPFLSQGMLEEELDPA